MGDRWTGSVAEYECDRLGFMLSARDKHGGLVTFDVNSTIVNDLDLARTVLDSRAGFEIVGNFLNQRLRDRDLSRRADLRRHLNAGLRSAAVRPLAPLAAGVVVEAIRRARRDRGDAINPLVVLEPAISTLIANFYFGTGGGVVRAAVEPLLAALSEVFGNPFALPANWPTPRNLRIRRCYRRLRAVVDPLVRSRVTSGRIDDFASEVAVAASTAGHTLEEISNLLIGSLLAAQRVPAVALAWTLWELGRSPQWCEASRVDPSHLQAAVSEAVRLHPPTWRLHRVAIRAVELGGYRFEAGHNFIVSPYVIHRDTRLFDNPSEFRPERWVLPGSKPPAPLSFGHGLHRCPGRDASYTVLLAAVGALLEHFDVYDVSLKVVPDPRTTLTPTGLRLRFAPRPGATRDLGRVRTGFDHLDALREPLPGRLARDPEGLADLCPRDLSRTS